MSSTHTAEMQDVWRSACVENSEMEFRYSKVFLLKCALFAALVCARPWRSPCPMVNATSLLAPRDADMRGVFVVSYAMKRWQYAWRWHVLRIMQYSVINVRKL